VNNTERFVPLFSVVLIVSDPSALEKRERKREREGGAEKKIHKNKSGGSKSRKLEVVWIRKDWDTRKTERDSGPRVRTSCQISGRNFSRAGLMALRGITHAQDDPSGRSS